MSLHDYIWSVNRINADHITLEHQKPNKSFSTFSSNVTVQNWQTYSHPEKKKYWVITKQNNAGDTIKSTLQNKISFTFAYI